MSKTYIRQIMKGLKCSKEKREEIQRQLQSDIMIAEENGEKLEEITKRMGSPSEIIQEFNASFSEEERKKYKKEKWSRRLIAAAIILIVLITGIYWMIPKGAAIEDSSIFEKNVVEEQAKQVINLLNGGEYEALAQESVEKLKPAMTEEYMEEAKNSLSSDWGEFQTFGKVYMTQLTQMGKIMAVVQVNAAYENVSITYTITFDKDMKLAGLYMK